MTTQATDSKPRVGISQCLLGDRVRYDGDSKPLPDATITALNEAFDLVAVCPEVEAGLGTPRPPVQLTTSMERPEVTGRDDAGLDVTERLYSYSENRVKDLDGLSGYVFKSRSPSCGLNSAPVFINNEQVTDSGRGVFAATLCTHYPHLVMIEETELAQPDALTRFIQAVSAQPA